MHKGWEVGKRGTRIVATLRATMAWPLCCRSKDRGRRKQSTIAAMINARVFVVLALASVSSSSVLVHVGGVSAFSSSGLSLGRSFFSHVIVTRNQYHDSPFRCRESIACSVTSMRSSRGPSSTVRLYDAAVNGESNKADDDDDFDPLLSPHQYPSGIAAGAVRADVSSSSSSVSAASAASQDTTTGTTTGRSSTAQVQQKQRRQDINSDDFDPFLTSPNDFPSAGIDNGQGREENDKGLQQERAFGFDASPPVPATTTTSTQDNVEDDNWSPLRDAMDVEKFAEDEGEKYNKKVKLRSDWAVPSATSAAPAQAYLQQLQQQQDKRNADADLFDVFDPRLSPHAYPSGIPVPNRAIGTDANTSAEVKVGVLLIDHGSKRASSNDRLVELAAAYQERSPSHYVVRASHMEIAKPSVEDGIRELISLGVGKIICHPYFLSPGRHVVDDIPQLVEEATEVLGRPDIPIVTTDPVGSSIDVMVSAIGTLVDGTLREMDGGDDDDASNGGRDGDEYKLGGFFGNVQRMIDEQLD
mmetsp:Transcript_23585/g.48836  ORF Transcript_23585/g.48836 Transcript_23585/m.48836 type:complete len:528 (+) Transcript_23585:4-1587(+)